MNLFALAIIIIIIYIAYISSVFWRYDGAWDKV